jgi:glycogen operon protein
MRRPVASVNFVTAHDGFTLHDLVSYNDKHNEANGEGNADGESNNRSWNCGAEGQSADPVVLELRQRQQRNFLATLLLSQGVPMLLGGDEIGRTQRGNNNGYCQDNEVSWFDWAHLDTELLDFTRRLIALRREHTVLRRKRWFQGRPIRGTIDLGWYRPDGDRMSDQDWNAGFARTIGMFLNGQSITEPDADGNRVVDATFLLLFNADPADMDWVLPKDQTQAWEPILDTNGPVPHDGSTGAGTPAGATYRVHGRSVVVLRAAHEQT